MTNDLDHDLRDTFRRHEQDVLGHGPTTSRSMFRRIRRRQTGTVLMAVVATAAIAIAGISGLGAIRSSEQTPAVPGGAETGPAETRPTENEVMSIWLPPRGAEPSTPADGKLLLSDGDMSPWWFLQVYADGRVIWLNETYAYGSNDLAHAFWQERRLTPEGVELLRSGVIRLGGQFHGPTWKLPASAWEDPEAKPYVPSRYVVCASHETLLLLPQRARDLLSGYTNEQPVVRGEDEFSRGGPGFACPAVTIEEARALDKIFLEAGAERANTIGVLLYNGTIGSISVIPLLPDGTLGECGC
jgi:hypothetical protein